MADPSFLDRDSLDRDSLPCLILRPTSRDSTRGVNSCPNARASIESGPYPAAFFASFVLQALGGLVFWRLERGAALSVALASGNRNMAILIAAMGPAAHPDFGLFFAVVQFPIYLLPAVLGPLYRRATRVRTL